MKKILYLSIATILMFSCSKNESEDVSDYTKDSGIYVDIRDNHEYKWVKIGDQIWMAENFAYKASEGSYAYDNDESKVEKYGRLYNWETSILICPQGWHLPTDSDFEELAQYVSNENGGYLAYGIEYITGGQEWEDVGFHLKSTSGWIEDDNGSDDYGFNAYPAGSRWTSGEYSGLGSECILWSSSEHQNSFGNVNGILRGINENHKFAWGYDSKSYGYCVRYIKD